MLPSFTSPLDGEFTVGNTNSFTIDTSGMPTASVQLVGTLPTGLNFTDNGDGTATISGDPAAGSGGISSIPITVTNKYGSDPEMLNLTINEAPQFTGTQTGLTCAGGTDSSQTSRTFTAGNLNSWTLCASGYTPAAISVTGTLPAGIGFVDNGDGSATISGSAQDGSSGDYPLTITVSNPAGSSQASIDLSVQEGAHPTSDDNYTFLAGQANTFTMTAVGSPTPTFNIFGPPAPDWVTLTDNHDGTATLSGTPPLDAAGNSYFFSVNETNGVGNGFTPDTVIINVPAIAFSDSTPPDGSAGDTYSYTFSATDESPPPPDARVQIPSQTDGMLRHHLQCRHG